MQHKQAKLSQWLSLKYTLRVVYYYFSHQPFKNISREKVGAQRERERGHKERADYKRLALGVPRQI